MEGSKITIRTDHRSLASIRSKRDLPTRVSRFVEIIEYFDPIIVNRKGLLNHLPDWLSRPKSPQPSPSALTNIDLVAITLEMKDLNWHDIERITLALLLHDESALTPEESTLAQHDFMVINNQL